MQRPADGALISFAAHPAQSIQVSFFTFASDRVDRNFDGLIVALQKVVDADQDAFVGVDFLLVAVCGIGDFALWEAALDGVEHAAQRVNLGKVVEAALFHTIGQRFDHVAAAQRIDGVGHAALVGDDLLRSQRDAHGFFRRQRHGFIHAVGVQ